MIRRAAAPAALALAVSLAPARALADPPGDDPGTALFRQAMQLVGGACPDDPTAAVTPACVDASTKARDLFARSFETNHHASRRYNQALCEERIGQSVEAYEHYTDAGRLAQDEQLPPLVQLATAGAARAAQKVARVEVTADPGVRVRIADDAGRTRDASRGGTIALPPGHYTVTASAPGRRPWSTTFDATAGSARTIAVPTLDEAGALVTFEAAPEDVVSVDGQVLPLPPPPQRLSPGSHQISATAMGKKPWSTEIEVTDEPVTVRIPELEDAAPAKSQLVVALGPDAPADATLTVDGARAPFGAMTVDPGHHTIVIAAEGKKPQTLEVDAPAGGTTNVTIPALESLAPATPPPQPPAASQPAPAPPPSDDDLEERKQSASRGRTAGIVLVTIGLSVVAVSGVFMFLGNQENDTIQSGGFSTASDIQSEASKGKTFNTVAIITGAAGGALTLLGAGLIVFNPTPTARVGVAPLPSGGGTLVGRLSW